MVEEVPTLLLSMDVYTPLVAQGRPAGRPIILCLVLSVDESDLTGTSCGSDGWGLNLKGD